MKGFVNMLNLYQLNGVVTYIEEINLRTYLSKTLTDEIKKVMHAQNKEWRFHQIESPSLLPRELANSNYTADDIYELSDGLCLRPETTPATYKYLEYILGNNTEVPPICAWQMSKSFRKEQDQATKHCRFKEFYQQEYQCVYSADTKNDYIETIIEPLAEVIKSLIGLKTRIVLSDRLPSYSLKTIDIEVWNSDKWMEVASISKRKDFTFKPLVKSKSIDCLVLEIAIGIDRLVYNYMRRNEVLEISMENTLK